MTLDRGTARYTAYDLGSMPPSKHTNDHNNTFCKSALSNTSFLANCLQQQIAALPLSVCRTSRDLLYNDTYALGYVFGFAEQASRYANGSRHDAFSRTYVETVFSGLFDARGTAENLVSFAVFQREDHVFGVGYRDGLSDLIKWVKSRCQDRPTGLTDYFR